MSALSREEVLLEEWKACEGTIRNFDNILTQIRFYGFTITIALMGAAAEALRSPQATISIAGTMVHVAFIIEALSTILAILLWIFHEHYLQFLLKVVDRQREIEQNELLINGKDVLKLGQRVSRKQMPRFIRDPWRYLFLTLIVLGCVLTFIYGQPQLTAHIGDC